MRRRLVSLLLGTLLALAATSSAMAEEPNGQAGYEGQPGNQAGGGGQTGYEGQPGNQAGGGGQTG
jgi:hypothetical protein